MDVMAVTVVGAGVVSVIVGLRLGGKLGLFDSRTKGGISDGERLSVEHFKLGRAHAIVGQRPSLASEAYMDGYSAGQRLTKRAECALSRECR